MRVYVFSACSHARATLQESGICENADGQEGVRVAMVRNSYAALLDKVGLGRGGGCDKTVHRIFAHVVDGIDLMILHLARTELLLSTIHHWGALNGNLYVSPYGISRAPFL